VLWFDHNLALPHQYGGKRHAEYKRSLFHDLHEVLWKVPPLAGLICTVLTPCDQTTRPRCGKQT
jgi:hypothetical protein